MGRQKWTDQLGFTMACIATSVGLGNIWRFPYLAYENGGAAFVVAYIVVVSVLGIPLYFFELAMGQFCSKGGLKMFRSLAPAYTGIGALQIFTSFFAASYWCSLLAIALYYLVKSMNLPLPWIYCYSQYEDICLNSTNSAEYINLTSSTELFFIKYLLNEPNNLDHGIGMPIWKLVFALGVTWFGIFFIVTKQGRESGKFHYFFGLYPHFTICIMLGIALAQKGSAVGLYYFFQPTWSKLLDARVWYNAVCQCFFSLGLGFGSIPSVASLNPFKTNIHTASLVIPLVDTCTSLLCGITVFSMLGNMAHRLNTEVPKVVKSGGIGLMFITYPEALGKVTAAPFVMAIVCFTMIYALGFGSLVVLQQIASDQIVDWLGIEYWQAAALSSIIGFLLGITYVTQGGMYILELVDYFGVGMVLYAVVLLEILSVVYGYGLRSFCWDIEYMTLRKIGIWRRCVWSLITPISLIVIYCGYLSTLPKGMKMKGVEYPTIALICGWLLFLVGITLVPGFAIYQLYKNREEGCPQMFWSIFNYENWCPANENDIYEWRPPREPQDRRNNALVDFLKAVVRR